MYLSVTASAWRATKTRQVSVASLLKALDQDSYHEMKEAKLEEIELLPFKQVRMENTI